MENAEDGDALPDRHRIVVYPLCTRRRHAQGYPTSIHLYRDDAEYCTRMSNPNVIYTDSFTLYAN